MIERDLALGLFGPRMVVAATIVADGMLQCKTSEESDDPWVSGSICSKRIHCFQSAAK
jgi:hypothetical protein